MNLSTQHQRRHWISVLAVLAVVASFWKQADAAISGYSNSPTQYHIQTDEGPERFFRFQTYNGQYRRERRLDDGSVLGSYGWVDPAGFLRMTDYIADGKGFRIVKTRMEYVGVKPVPEEPPVKPHTPMKHSVKVVLGDHYPFSTAVPPVNTLPQAQALRKRGVAVARNIDASEPKAVVRSTSESESIDNARPTFRRPVKSRVIRVYRRPVANKFSSTFEAEPTTADGIRVVTKSRPANPHLIRTIAKDDVFKDYVTPLKRSPGFLYKIPNQYHKEETRPDGSRGGSFGYVDPYGIRRVIHYNAGKDGFEHEKDFHYVGKQY